jgi:hypothetical protein
MYQGYHRWMQDYCGLHLDRLKGVVLCSARDVDAAVSEIQRWGKTDWPLGVFVYAPYGGMPLDHPDLEPIWASAANYDLSVVLHTFTVAPPYPPGGLDTWDNLWLQRSAAHPWSGMRGMAALIGSGVMDRYPELRIGTLEGGHGWLPFWVKRLEEHQTSIPAALPPLPHRISDYVQSGRHFQSIEISEGEALTKAVIDLMGRGDFNVRLGLSTWRKLVPGFHADSVGMGQHQRDGEAQIDVWQCGAILSQIRIKLERRHASSPELGTGP